MGMFDQEPTFEDHFSEGDVFVAEQMVYDGTINTKFGTAERSRILARKRGEVSQWYSMVGTGFAAQAKRVAEGDLPAVVRYVKVPTNSGNFVKRLDAVKDRTVEQFDAVLSNDSPF